MLWCSWAHDIVQAHFSLLYFPVLGESRLLQFYVLVGVMLMSLIVMSNEHLLRLLLFLLLHHQLLLSLSLSLFLLHFQFSILFFVPLCFPTRSHPPLSTLRCFSCRTSDPRQSWMKVRAGIWRRIFFSSCIFNDTFFPLLSRGWVSYNNILMPSFETEKFIYISQKKKRINPLGFGECYPHCMNM